MRFLAWLLVARGVALLPPQLLVVSLPKPPNGADGSAASKVWRWKEAALGHGQDYLSWPREPHRALGDALFADPGDVELVEAAALGTCARLDFYLLARDGDARRDDDATLGARAADLVAELLVDVTGTWRAAGSPSVRPRRALARRRSAVGRSITPSAR